MQIEIQLYIERMIRIDQHIKPELIIYSQFVKIYLLF